MVFFGPSSFHPVELNLAAPHKVFWVASIITITLMFCRLFLQLTADIARKIPRIVTFIYIVGAYAYCYVCIHMAHNLESSSTTNSVAMMLRWSFIMGAVFLAMAPVFLIMPLNAADLEMVINFHVAPSLPARNNMSFHVFISELAHRVRLKPYDINSIQVS